MSDVEQKILATKPKAGRSPAYPSVSVKVAIEKAKALYAAEGKYAVPVSSALGAWGFGAKSSGGRVMRATLRYYGLINVEGDGDNAKVKLSEEALRVLLDEREDQTEKKAIIRRLALLPTIHKKLLERFPEGIKSEATVQHFLVFDEGFNEQAAREIIKEFKETAAFADLYKPAVVADIKPVDKDGTDGKDAVLPDVGDLVQAEINGAFKAPKRVRQIQLHEGKDWVFVDGEESGIPLEQIEIIEKGTGMAANTTMTVTAPRLALPKGTREAKFPLAEGEVTITFPEALSPESVEDLESYIQVFLKKAKREAKPN